MAVVDRIHFCAGAILHISVRSPQPVGLWGFDRSQYNNPHVHTQTGGPRCREIYSCLLVSKYRTEIDSCNLWVTLMVSLRLLGAPTNNEQLRLKWLGLDAYQSGRGSAFRGLTIPASFLDDIALRIRSLDESCTPKKSAKPATLKTQIDLLRNHICVRWQTLHEAISPFGASITRRLRNYR